MFRKIHIADYENKYISLLEQLTNVGDISKETFINFVNNLTDNHQVWIYEDNITHKILATGTLIKEQKLINGFSKYAQIEDVVVDEKFRNTGLGKLLIKKLVEEANDCYRVNLLCRDELVLFYEKCGFHRRGNQMTIDRN